MEKEEKWWRRRESNPRPERDHGELLRVCSAVGVSPSRGPTDGAQERQPGSVSPFENRAVSRGLLLYGVRPGPKERGPVTGA